MCILCCALLMIPRMEIQAPGEGIMARKTGTVTEVSDDRMIAAGIEYPLNARNSVKGYTRLSDADPGLLIFPKATFWQEPIVSLGEEVEKKQLLARGVTHIFFQANVWIFTFLVFMVGIMMGIGKAAVYKFIPEYFPNDVGVVGGIVGVVGGLGGFVCPVIFGYLLRGTGIWTTCWMFFFGLSVICLVWLHLIARRLMKARAPEVLRELEEEIGTTGFAPVEVGK